MIKFSEVKQSNNEYTIDVFVVGKKKPVWQLVIKGDCNTLWNTPWMTYVIVHKRIKGIHFIGSGNTTLEEALSSAKKFFIDTLLKSLNEIIATPPVTESIVGKVTPDDTDDTNNFIFSSTSDLICVRSTPNYNELVAIFDKHNALIVGINDWIVLYMTRYTDDSGTELVTLYVRLYLKDKWVVLHKEDHTLETNSPFAITTFINKFDLIKDIEFNVGYISDAADQVSKLLAQHTFE